MSKLELAIDLLNVLEHSIYKRLPKAIGLIRKAQCSHEWQQNPGNFLKYMKDSHGLNENESHQLIALFRVESLKQEFKNQAPTEAEAYIALKYFGIGANIGLSGHHMDKHLQKRLDSFDRKNSPVSCYRTKSHFSNVMEYLYCLCLEKGKAELIAPGNPDGFLEFVQKVIRDGKNQDQYVSERIDRVVKGAHGYVYMHGKYSKTTKIKKGEDPREYNRASPSLAET